MKKTYFKIDNLIFVKLFFVYYGSRAKEILFCFSFNQSEQLGDNNLILYLLKKLFFFAFVHLNFTLRMHIDNLCSQYGPHKTI